MNTKHLTSGCVYPIYGTRTIANITDKFDFTPENGFFIGLYLAEGSSHIKSGKLSIANNDPIILSLVEKWFSNQNIAHKTYIKPNNVNHSVSTSIHGYNTVLVLFLRKLLGDSSKTKHIPAVFFNAPDSFLLGLLDGYFSGVGTITKNSIGVSSASKELINGISMILTRFGIFSKISVAILKSKNCLSIRSIFALKFSSLIKLSHPSKNKQLQLIANSGSILKHSNMYPIQNDTILDEIISIDTISSKEYPKVYDLTIPTTLNFGLANGLQVYDTSDTGYLQRKLIKSMEDVKIGSGNYVQTINGQIVQFLYGGDSLDGSFLEREVMTPIDMDHYIIKTSELSSLFTKSSMPISPDFQEQELIKLKSLAEPTSPTECVPFNIQRLLDNTFKPRGSKKSLVSYAYLYDNLTKLIDNLFVNKMLECTDKQYIKNIEYILLTKLAPKVLLKKWYFTKPQYQTLLASIEAKYNRSIVDPGECVGPLAAQAIGESLTQLTLNTFHSAGIASQTQITSGIPRFRELINVSKKPQNSIITIVPNNDINTNEETVYTLAEHLVYTTLELFIDNLEIVYDTAYNYNIPDIYNTEERTEISPWVVAITLNAKAMFSKKVYTSTIVDILTNFCKSSDVGISCTHDNAKELIVYLRANTHTTENYNTMTHIIQELPKIWVCGQQQIIDTFVEAKQDTFNIYTSGGRLEDILVLPFVNPTKTYTDNIFNTFDVLGMEATRELLFLEIQKLLEENGVSINKRHVELLVDTITHRTILLSMDRHGIKKSEASVLSSCSFEETVDQLARASIFSQYDDLVGVTPDIILGQLGKFGTSTSELVYKL